MSDTPKPESSPEEMPDVPGPLPELPSLDPMEPAEGGEPSNDSPAPSHVPLVQPGTQ